MEPFQIILNDLGCTLGLFSLCKVSKSVSTSDKKRGDTRLSNQISLIQFIQQVAVSDIGHALIDKIVDTTWPLFIIPKQFPKAYHDYFDQRIYRAANTLLK